MKVSAAALLFLAWSSAHGASITYEVYAIPDGVDGPKHLLHKGVRTYSVKDVVDTENQNDPEHGHRMSLEVIEGFKIGASVYAEEKTEGFGLWLEKEPGSFSWEWFDIETPGVFKKLQGAGHLKVELKGAPVMQQPVRFEFQEDIVLRMREAGCPDPDKETHLMIVKKGSIFQVP